MPRSLLLSSTILIAGLAAAPAITVSAAAQTSAETAEAPMEQSADAALSAFFESFDQAELAFSPLTKSFRGIRDADYGTWGDFSDADTVAEQERLIAARDQMRASFANADLNDQSRLSFQLFERMAERSAAAFEFRGNDYIFDQMNGAQSQLPAFLINIPRVTEPAHAEAYISRLTGLGTVIDQLITEAEAREANGVVPPDWVFPYIISDTRNVITGAPFSEGDDTPLYDDLQSKVNSLYISDEEKA